MIRLPYTSEHIIPPRWRKTPPTDRKIVARHLRTCRTFYGRHVAWRCLDELHFCNLYPWKEWSDE